MIRSRVKAVQNGRQLALKISANSVYGFTGLWQHFQRYTLDLMNRADVLAAMQAPLLASCHAWPSRLL